MRTHTFGDVNPFMLGESTSIITIEYDRRLIASKLRFVRNGFRMMSQQLELHTNNIFVFCDLATINTGGKCSDRFSSTGMAGYQTFRVPKDISSLSFRSAAH